MRSVQLNERLMTILQAFVYSVIPLVEIFLAYIWIHTDVLGYMHKFMLTRHIGIELWSHQGWFGISALGIPVWWIMIMLSFLALPLCNWIQQSGAASNWRPPTAVGHLLWSAIVFLLTTVIASTVCAWHPPPSVPPHSLKRISFQDDCITVTLNPRFGLYNFQGTPEIYSTYYDSAIYVPGILYCGNWNYLSGMKTIRTGIITHVWSLKIHLTGLILFGVTILVVAWRYRYWRRRAFGIGFPVQPNQHSNIKN